MSEAQKPLVYDNAPPAELSNGTKVDVAKNVDKANDTTDAPQGAARTIHVTIQNDTGHNFILVGYGKDNDSRWEKVPPNRIDFPAHGQFEVDSDGTFAGAHGWARYKFEDEDGHEFYFQFDNPWAGSNSYVYTAPFGYNCTVKGGDGLDAYVTFECWRAQLVAE